MYVVYTHCVFYRSLQYPLNGEIGKYSIQNWWGNTVFTATADWREAPLKTLPSGEKFGCVVFRIRCSTPNIDTELQAPNMVTPSHGLPFYSAFSVHLLL